MTMPHIQGDKLAREFVEIRRDIPVILCTGFNKRLRDGYLGDTPFKGLLMKPIIRSELAVLVRKILDEAAHNTMND
jgi:CheY-like chemotaxis protein